MHVTAQSAAEMVMAMLNGDNEDDETPYLDEINAAIRRMQCAACGAFDKHYTAMCPDAMCVYCKRGPGKGHEETCPRYTAWQKGKLQAAMLKGDSGNNKGNFPKGQFQRRNAGNANRFRKQGNPKSVNMMVGNEDNVDSEDALARIAMEKVAIMTEKRKPGVTEERIAFLESQVAELNLLEANIDMRSSFEQGACLKHAHDTRASPHSCVDKTPAPTVRHRLGRSSQQWATMCQRI
jgi:hypothetical protein